MEDNLAVIQNMKCFQEHEKYLPTRLQGILNFLIEYKKTYPDDNKPNVNLISLLFYKTKLRKINDNSYLEFASRGLNFLELLGGGIGLRLLGDYIRRLEMLAQSKDPKELNDYKYIEKESKIVEVPITTLSTELASNAVSFFEQIKKSEPHSKFTKAKQVLDSNFFANVNSEVIAAAVKNEVILYIMLLMACYLQKKPKKIDKIIFAARLAAFNIQYNASLFQEAQVYIYKNKLFWEFLEVVKTTDYYKISCKRNCEEILRIRFNDEIKIKDDVCNLYQLFLEVRSKICTLKEPEKSIAVNPAIEEKPEQVTQLNFVSRLYINLKTSKQRLQSFLNSKNLPGNELLAANKDYWQFVDNYKFLSIDFKAFSSDLAAIKQLPRESQQKIYQQLFNNKGNYTQEKLIIYFTYFAELFCLQNNQETAVKTQLKALEYYYELLKNKSPAITVDAEVAAIRLEKYIHSYCQQKMFPQNNHKTIKKEGIAQQADMINNGRYIIMKLNYAQVVSYVDYVKEGLEILVKEQKGKNETAVMQLGKRSFEQMTNPNGQVSSNPYLGQAVIVVANAEREKLRRTVITGDGMEGNEVAEQLSADVNSTAVGLVATLYD